MSVRVSVRACKGPRILGVCSLWSRQLREAVTVRGETRLCCGKARGTQQLGRGGHVPRKQNALQRQQARRAAVASDSSRQDSEAVT